MDCWVTWLVGISTVFQRTATLHSPKCLPLGLWNVTVKESSQVYTLWSPRPLHPSVQGWLHHTCPAASRNNRLNTSHQLKGCKIKVLTRLRHPQLLLGITFSKGTCRQATTDGATILVPCHVVKSLPLAWRLDTPSMKSMATQSSNDLQWFDLKIRHQDNSPNNSHQGDMPYNGEILQLRVELCCRLANQYHMLVANPGFSPTKKISIEFQILSKYICWYFLSHQTDHHTILHIPWQLYTLVVFTKCCCVCISSP